MNTSLQQKLFVSHASEDRDSVARPLADALIEAGFQVWYDEYSLTLGDSLKGQIDEGLSKADFGIVVLSHSFFEKQWPREELDGLVSLQSARRQKVILPVWHNLSFDDVARYSPTLAGKLAIQSTKGIPAVVESVVRSMNNINSYARRDDLDYGTIHIPMPRNSDGPYGLAAAASPPMHLVKIPGISWIEFGEHLLAEMRRLDNEAAESKTRAESAHDEIVSHFAKHFRDEWLKKWHGEEE